MYTEIKTFEDACQVLNLNPETVIPSFEFFPEADKEAMQAHAKLVIINKAIVGDWVPNWENGQWDKYYPWFEMGSPSGVGFASYDFACWNTISCVGSRLCFPTAEMAEYAGTQFLELYKSYFVKS